MPSKACNDLLSAQGDSGPAWGQLAAEVQEKIGTRDNPFSSAGMNADQIGIVHEKFQEAISVYRTLLQVQSRPSFAPKQYQALSGKVISGIKGILEKKSATSTELFAALETIRLISIVESKTERTMPEMTMDANQRAEEKQNQKQKEKGAGQPEKPQWKELSDRYKPKNKDLDENGNANNGENPVVFRSTAEAPKKLLRQIIYDVVTAKEFVSNPLLRPLPIADGHQASAESPLTHIATLDASQIAIPIQPDHEPVPGKYDGYEVLEKSPGEFVAEITRKNLKAISVPLRPTRRQEFAGVHNEGSYLHATGIDLKDWPSDIQLLVQKLKNSSQDRIAVASEMEKFFKKDGGYHYYSVGDRLSKSDLALIDEKVKKYSAKYAEPVAMAYGKAFNCDGSAWVGAILLRDYLGIPARIAAGRTTSGREQAKDGVLYHTSKANDPHHAWVEVWDGSKWQPFDMTPELNATRQDQQEQGEKSQDSGDESDDEKSSKPDESVQGEASEKSENQKDAAEEKKEEEQKKKDDGNRQISEGMQVKSSEQESSLSKSFYQEIFNVVRSSFAERLLMEKGRDALEVEYLKWLESVTTFETSSHSSFAVSWIKGIKGSVSSSRDEELSAWVGALRLMASQGRFRDAWLELTAMLASVDAVTQVRRLTSGESKFAEGIRDAMREFQQIKHVDSGAYDIVDKIHRSLPGNISKRWIRTKYGDEFMKLGSLALNKLALDIKRGKLSGLVRMALLNRFAEMVLNSDKIPSYKDQATLFRSPLPSKKQDLVIARSPLEIQRMLLQLLPGQHLFEPTFQGKQFAVGSREIRRVEDPKTPIEKKVSVVYYDVSGSMMGDKVTVQDTLLMNFVDKALSETDALGRPVHEVYLIPFGSAVYQSRGSHIKTAEDAQRFLSEKMHHETSAADGTDIEKALLHFYDLVADSYQKNIDQRAKQFKKANLILFTDGEGKVDLEKVALARKRVPSEVQINMNFIAIGGDNEELNSLARASNISSTKPMVRQLPMGEINGVVKASRAVQEDPQAFATDIAAADTPPHLTSRLTQLADSVVDFRQSADVNALQLLFAQVQAREIAIDKISNRIAPAQLVGLVSILVKSPLPSGMRQRIALSVLQVYPSAAGRSLDQMTYMEKDQFDALKNWIREAQ